MLKNLAFSAILFLKIFSFTGWAQTPGLLKDISNRTNSSSINFVANLGSLSFFAANDGINGLELWRTDGTEAGTFMLKDIAPGLNGSIPDPFGAEVLNGAVYFNATGTSAGLWKTDGTVEGTQLVSSAPGVPHLGNSRSIFQPKNTWQHSP